MDTLILQISGLDGENVDFEEFKKIMSPYGKVQVKGKNCFFHREIEIANSRGEPKKTISSLLAELFEIKGYLRSISDAGADLVFIWFADPTMRETYIFGLTPAQMSEISEFGIGINCPYWSWSVT